MISKEHAQIVKEARERFAKDFSVGDFNVRPYSPKHEQDGGDKEFLLTHKGVSILGVIPLMRQNRIKLWFAPTKTYRDHYKKYFGTGENQYFDDIEECIQYVKEHLAELLPKEMPSAMNKEDMMAILKTYHAIVWLNEQVCQLTGGRGMDGQEGSPTHDLFLLYDVIFRNSRFADPDDEEAFQELMYSDKTVEEKYELLKK